MRNLFILLSVSMVLSCKQQASDVSQDIKDDIKVTSDIEKPIMLDDIHYYTLDREACNQFFEKNFGTKAMLEESPNPFKFIDFQLVKEGQSTINISEQGPFPGIAVGDPKRWERTLVTPSPDNPPRYGVHWLAFSTSDLSASKIDLQANGIEIIDEDFKLPHTDSKSILCYGPDNNLIVVTQSSENIDGYAVDHLLLLVKSLDDNLKFFQDVFAGEVISKTDDMASMVVAGHKFVLAEPSALGLSSEKVIERDPKVFRPDIDHLGFLYENARKAYAEVSEKGYEFLSPPIPIKYYDKPTLYTFAITYTPDGLQVEMYSEEGRTTSRTKFKERS